MRLTERDVVDAVEEMTLRRLRQWVRNGWISPAASDGRRFDDIDVARIRLVCQLKDELKLNEDAVTVVLSLMDQVYGLRCELRALGAAIERQPSRVRREIVGAARKRAGK